MEGSETVPSNERSRLTRISLVPTKGTFLETIINRWIYIN